MIKVAPKEDFIFLTLTGDNSSILIRISRILTIEELSHGCRIFTDIPRWDSIAYTINHSGMYFVNEDIDYIGDAIKESQGRVGS